MASRRRPRLRSKGLVADSSTHLDLSAYEPLFALNTPGQAVWEHLVSDVPFWLTEADVPMISMFCRMTDVAEPGLRSASNSLAGKAAIAKEWRSMADQLGLSPTSRSRLKLSEANATAAARRAEALKDEPEPGREVYEVDDLLGDD